MKKFFIALGISALLFTGSFVAGITYQDIFTNILVKGAVDIVEVANIYGTPESTGWRLFSYSDGLYVRDDTARLAEITGLNHEADSDGGVVAANDAGKIMTNTGAVGGTIRSLPEASTVPRRKYTFCVTVAQNFDINPDDNDRIGALTNANGDAIRCATIGSCITLQALSDSQWGVVGQGGTWTDVN